MITDKFGSNFSQPKKILIVGYGFLGSRLSNYLVNRKFDVGVLSRNSTHFNSSGSKIKFHHANNNLFESVKYFDPDIVIHAAGSGSPSKYESQPQLVDRELENLTKELIRYWNQNNFRLIFFSSGGAVYGPDFTMPINENCNMSPVSNYGTLKKIQEEILIENQIKNDKELLVLRISNVYHLGNPVRESHGFIETCLGNLDHNKVIKVYGTDKITRDFIFIQDFFSAVEKLIDVGITNETLNLGTGIGTTIGQIIEFLTSFSGKTLNVEIVKDLQEKVLYNVLDVSKLKKMIDFKPSSVEENLRNYFKTN